MVLVLVGRSEDALDRRPAGEGATALLDVRLELAAELAQVALHRIDREVAERAQRTAEDPRAHALDQIEVGVLAAAVLDLLKELDEPASALDPVSTQKIEDTMEQLKQSYTVVIVTHNMQQAARISDYTGFFFIENMGDPGRLWECDETEKMFSNPERKETEDYVTGRFG